ncbi:hypothetical protein DFJ73DRAFT_872920 [Zopfochytrium polystomum]|nr:hypothetical protein DFJ73DRAFT_872920 [Zopfochytrium polystomum]
MAPAVPAYASGPANRKKRTPAAPVGASDIVDAARNPAALSGKLASSGRKPRQPASSERAVAKDAARDGSSRSGSPLSDAHSASSAAAAPKMPVKRRKTEYIPRYRSGAWSILITLLKCDGGTGFLSKQDIIRLGQAHADMPLDLPGPNGMYSGWSSITSLLEKQLVIKYGNPPRFSLTDEGLALAEKMIQREQEIQANQREGFGFGSGFENEDSFSDGDDAEPRRQIAPGLVPSTSLSRSPSSLSSSSHAAPRPAVRLSASPSSKPTSSLPATYSHIPSSQPSTSSTASRPPLFPTMRQAVSAGLTVSTASLPAAATATAAAPPPALRKAQSFPAELRDVYRLDPGTFEVVLLVDGREVKSASERTFFQNGLASHNVKFDTRQLVLGDTMWVARPRGSTIVDEDREIVLDIIVERKTMDDLVGSIKDGRFAEQKFRLESCGIPNKVYLVEITSMESAQTFGLEGVFTAITQTQVENNFFVKMTSSPEETLKYLVALTNQLSTKFERMHLRAADLTKDDPRFCRSSGGQFTSRTLSHFSRDSIKTKNFTLCDVWVRQLMTVPGVSAEKAAAIAEKYGTSRAFFLALSECATSEEREKLVTTIGGSGRRALGPTVSKRLINVFWA